MLRTGAAFAVAARRGERGADVFGTSRECHSEIDLPPASARPRTQRSKPCFSFAGDFSIDRRMTNRLISWLLAVSLFFAASIAALAQAATPTPAEVAAQNVKRIDPAAATQAWLATVPQEKREKSDAYLNRMHISKAVIGCFFGIFFSLQGSPSFFWPPEFQRACAILRSAPADSRHSRWLSTRSPICCLCIC